MSAARITLLVILCAVSSVWAALALSAQFIQLKNHSLIASIYSGKMQASEQPELEKVIASYEKMMRFVPCNVPLSRDLTLLLTQNADIALATPDGPGEDTYLAKTLDALVSLLSCTPTDGKAWLDYATLNTYREGFTARSLNAYKISERVSPGESWLAEKRLLFALKFRPLFDEAGREAARKDIATLERANHYRINAILKTYHLKSTQDLYPLFIN